MEQFLVAFFLLPLLATVQSSEVKVEGCEAIKIPLCQDMLYNATILPTLLGHTTQEDAARDLTQFQPFLTGGCASDLRFLLCYLYSPVCTVLESALPPCRAVCTRAKQSCEKPMAEAQFVWPENMNCEKFPENGLCVRRLPEPTATAAPADTRTGAPDRSRQPGAKPEIEDADLQNKTNN